MDIVTLTAFISPFLPFLVKLGDKATAKATETIAEKFSESAWTKAQAIWEKLSPKVEGKEAAKEAVADVANNPEDEESRIVLKRQLQKLLEQDEELAEAIAQILQADSADGTSGIQIIQNVTGNQNQVIGQVRGGQVFGTVQGNVTNG
jgi:Flp pilus assembly protein TadD